MPETERPGSHFQHPGEASEHCHGSRRLEGGTAFWLCLGSCWFSLYRHLYICIDHSLYIYIYAKLYIYINPLLRNDLCFLVRFLDSKSHIGFHRLGAKDFRMVGGMARSSVPSPFVSWPLRSWKTFTRDHTRILDSQTICPF